MSENITLVGAGTTGKITAIKGDARFLSRASSIGLIVGSFVQVLANERNRPVLLYSRDTMIAVNRTEAQQIFMDTDTNLLPSDKGEQQ